MAATTPSELKGSAAAVSDDTAVQLPDEQQVRESIDAVVAGLRGYAQAEGDALTASRDAQYRKFAYAYGVFCHLVDDADLYARYLEEARVEATEPLEKNRALGVIKVAHEGIADKDASAAAVVLKGLAADGVKPDGAFAHLKANGTVKVAKKGREGNGGDAKQQKAKRDALVAERGDLGTAKVEPGVEAAASGFVVLLAKPDGKGGVKVHGASNDDGVVDRTLALVAKNVRL